MNYVSESSQRKCPRFQLRSMRTENKELLLKNDENNSLKAENDISNNSNVAKLSARYKP